MKRTLYILSSLIVLSLCGCKKDNVKIQDFSIVSEIINKHAESIIITVEYSYPSVVQTVEGYLSDNSSMNNAQHVRGEINKKNFTLRFKDLQANTTYYYYFEYSNGIDALAKSEVKTISTCDYHLPIVKTNDVTNVTTTTACCGGIITDNGEAEIIARGVCYGLNPNPTIEDNHTIDNVETGNFVSSLVDLNDDTEYYVRAYATNVKGTSYGENRSFRTLWKPVGCLKGLFSVSDSKRVFFSKGNLQYKASSNTWRFAENQYEYVGNDNNNISSTYNGWIDLFAWGTSGYNHGAVCYQPYSTSENCDNYYAYGSYTNDLNNHDGRADWGYNAIINGGNKENKWYTLTKDEWLYVFNIRSTTSNIRFAKAQINEIIGFLLLPDDWDANIYNLISPNNPDSDYTSNIISLDIFTNVLESNGVVFLPAAGRREGTSTTGINISGVYWSASTYYNESIGQYYNAYYFSRGNSFKEYRRYGCSVRLVCDIE